MVLYSGSYARDALLTLRSLFTFAVGLHVEVTEEYYEGYVVQRAELHHPHRVVARVAEPEQHVQVEEHVEGELRDLETDFTFRERKNITSKTISWLTN